MNKFLLAAAAVAAFIPAFAQDADTEPIDYLNSDYYVIGSNVNGKSWAEGADDAKFEAKGDGVFEWTGDVLGTGFKINNGTWAVPELNFGAASETQTITLDKSFTLTAGNESKNIGLAAIDGVDYSKINNPKIVLTVNGSEVSIVLTGEPAGEAGWFLPGDYNDWNVENEEFQFKKGDDGLFTLRVEFEEAGEFKVAWTGWAMEYGSEGSGDDQLVLGMGEDSAKLTKKGDGVDVSNVKSYFVGKYDVTWNPETAEISFVEVIEDNAVEEIGVDNGETTYFTLQGVKVIEPANGLYIKVVNGKANKVIVK